MAVRKYNTNEYIYGAEAPARIYSEPVHREEIVPRRSRALTEEEKIKRQREEYAAENRRKAAKFGIAYTLFIVSAVAVTLFVCVQYLTRANRKRVQTREMAVIQQELTKLRESNDGKQFAIDTAVDINYIYDVATKELGMIHPDSQQVISYESGESEYVIQYKDVPGAN